MPVRLRTGGPRPPTSDWPRHPDLGHLEDDEVAMAARAARELIAAIGLLAMSA
jgi:hypothetical protein